jgi:hypothetical protein
LRWRSLTPWPTTRPPWPRCLTLTCSRSEWTPLQEVVV